MKSHVIAALLAATLISLPARAADKWTRVQSKNFTLAGNASENQIRGVAEELEVFRTAFSKFFNIPARDTTVPTTVIVFKTDDAFKPYKPLYQGKPANIAGYFQKGQDLNYIALSADIQTPRVIYHELVHRLLSDSMSSLPPWFQEGFAECFSSVRVFGKDKKVQMGHPIGEHVALLTQRNFTPLEKLFAVTHGSAEYNEEEKQGLFYAESWAFVHYMMFNEPQRRAQFITFLNKLKGGNELDAFREVFNTDVASFQKTFEAYIQQRLAWNAFELATPEGLARSKDMTARTISEAESEYFLGDLLLHSQRLNEAETHLTKAVKLDAKLGMAQAAMGRLLMRKNNNDDALAYLRRATELDPDNYLAHYYHASLLNSRRATTLSDADWTTMRSELHKTIQLAPQFVEATEMLASANLSRNVDIPQTAEMLVNALKIAPGRDYLILQLAFVVSRTPQRESARPLLASLMAKLALDPPIRQSAQNLLAFLDTAAATPGRSAVAATGPGLPELRRDSPPVSGGSRSAMDDDSLKEGDGRARGVLKSLDCRNGMTLSLDVQGEIMKFHTATPNAIRFTSDNPAVSTQVACGPMPGNGVAALIVFKVRPNGESKGEPLSVNFVDEFKETVERLAVSFPGSLAIKGFLTKLECSGDVSISFVSDGKPVKFASVQPSKVALVNGPNSDGTFDCTTFPAPGLPVIVVYRPSSSGDVAGEPVLVQHQK
jgi:tetratricopeptide (TPR) repeat protein